MARRRIDLRWVKPPLFLLCLLPLSAALLIDLGANPVERLIHLSGDWALRLLLITLAVTPLQRLSGIGELAGLRRMLGLFAFFYAMLHATLYFVLDQGFDPTRVLADVFERPYITLGVAVLLTLIPLAVTSHTAVMRKMGGRRWKRLHRLVYLSALGGVLHFLWLVKADHTEPLIYLAILCLLLVLRMPFLRALRLPEMRRRIRLDCE